MFVWQHPVSMFTIFNVELIEFPSLTNGIEELIEFPSLTNGIDKLNLIITVKVINN